MIKSTVVDDKVVHRLVRGFGANLYGQAVIVAIQLSGVPILLQHWLPTLYGEWLILAAIPFYLSLTDLGFSQSAANDMTARVARGDRSGALSAFQSLWALILLVIVVGLILLTAATTLLPLGSWIHFSRMSVHDVRWVMWLLCAEVLLKLQDGVNHAGFRASGDYALHTSVYYSTLLMQHASVWLLAALGRGPVAAALAFLLIRLAVTPAVAIWLTRRHRWLHLGFDHAHLAQLRALIRPALANIGIPLSQALNVQGMVLLLGALLGPLAVVTFSTLRTLTRLALQLVQIVGNAAEPEFAAAFGSDNRDLLQNLYRHVLRGGLWLSLAAASGLMVAGGAILQLWTHGKVKMDPQLFHWLLASAVASVLWYGSLITLKAANRHLRISIVYAVASGTALLLAAILVRAHGQAASAGMSLLVMDAVMAVYALRAAASLRNSSVTSDLLSALNPLPLVELLAQKRRDR